MMRIVRALRCALLVSAATLLASEAEPLAEIGAIGPSLPTSPRTSAEVAACIRAPQCTDVYVVSHRARGFGGPDNSREAIQNAIAAGQSVIEIDLRRTRDGEVVLLHNRRIEAGPLARHDIGDLSVADLAQVHLQKGERIPRFSEIYDLSRGRIVLTLHCKADVVQAVAQWIAGHGSFDDVIFYVDRSGTLQSAAGIKRKHRSMLLMTRAYGRAHLGEARRVLGQLPELVHIYTDEAPTVSWFTHQGVKVAIKVGSLDHLVPPLRTHARARALRSGAQLILVDEPMFFRPESE
jgi:hypothetical protein